MERHIQMYYLRLQSLLKYPVKSIIRDSISTLEGAALALAIRETTSDCCMNILPLLPSETLVAASQEQMTSWLLLSALTARTLDGKHYRVVTRARARNTGHVLWECFATQTIFSNPECVKLKLAL